MCSPWDVDEGGSWQMETELRLRIVLVAPPSGVDFGLQDGKGHDYETSKNRDQKVLTSVSSSW